MTKPPRSILDPAFVYTPAKAHEGNADYLREKLRRLMHEAQRTSKVTALNPIAKVRK